MGREPVFKLRHGRKKGPTGGGTVRMQRKRGRIVDAVLAVDPDCPVGLEKRADLDLEIGAFESVLDLCDRWSRVDPENSRARALRGVALSHLGCYTQALDAFTEAIDLSPTVPGYFYNRANILRGFGRYRDAVEDYTRAIPVNANYARTPPAFNNRGLCYRDLGETDRAMADFEEAVRLRPGHTAALNNIADLCHQRGEYAEAIRHATRAVDAASRFGDPREDARLGEGVAHKTRADAYQALGETERALADYNAAIRLGWNRAYEGRGRLLEGQGKKEQARRDYIEFLRRCTGDRSAPAIRARLVVLGGTPPPL